MLRALGQRMNLLDRQTWLDGLMFKSKVILIPGLVGKNLVASFTTERVDVSNRNLAGNNVQITWN